MNEISQLKKPKASLPPLKKSDFQSNQSVRWCPGCGDYAILTAVQNTLAKRGVSKENTTFVSGIGCSSRFPYYMSTYGFHTIHGRAPAVATGLKLARPDLSVWVISGDGDALSIGANHFVHLLRRNLDINYLIFNNRIYGLTKGQYSPTSEKGKITKSSPMGSAERPLNPLALAQASGATFFARSLDRNMRHLGNILEQAIEHRGTSLVEIYQNCNIFNDKAFASFTDREQKHENALFLENGKPLVFGKTNDKGIALIDGKPTVVAADDPKVLVHREKENLVLNAIYHQMSEDERLPTPFGLMHRSDSPSFEKAMQLTDELSPAVASAINSAESYRKANEDATELAIDTEKTTVEHKQLPPQKEEIERERIRKEQLIALQKHIGGKNSWSI